jgi:hypothetical protein
VAMHAAWFILTCFPCLDIFRYALTLRIMLAIFRRRMGAGPIPDSVPEGMPGPSGFVDPSGVPAHPIPFTMEEVGYTWPSDRGLFNPSAIPIWLQEQVRFRFVLALLEVPHGFLAFRISQIWASLQTAWTASFCS